MCNHLPHRYRPLHFDMDWDYIHLYLLHNSCLSNPLNICICNYQPHLYTFIRSYIHLCLFNIHLCLFHKLYLKNHQGICIRKCHYRRCSAPLISPNMLSLQRNRTYLDYKFPQLVTYIGNHHHLRNCRTG